MTQVSTRRPRSPKAAAVLRRPIDQHLSADLFKALSDPTRLRLLACLAKCSRPCSVSEIAECCSVDLSVVSRHLALLERAGVVDASKQGRVVSYTVRYAHVSGMLRALADALDLCCPASCAPKKGGCCDAC
ncbi:MAG: winged helix-turn-helix transcriptional regulator [Phycisphaeraceae bacterium]|nr:winged helix-turn-helix transcriptional regulator [Phycisphaeraceae bacterium]